MEDNLCKGYLKGNANQHYRNFVCVDAELNNKVKSLKYFLGFKVYMNNNMYSKGEICPRD